MDTEMNLWQYTVLERLDPQEAYSLTGDDKYLNRATLYRIRLEREYLTNTYYGEEVYLYQPSYLTSQSEGMPLYCEGKTFLSPLRFITSTDFEYYVPYSELTFAVYNYPDDITIAYHICYENIIIESTKYRNLNLALSDSEHYVVTSTEENPTHYTQKTLLSELVAILRDDFAVKRMYFPLDENGFVIEQAGSKDYAYIPAIFNGSYDEKHCAFIAESYWLEPLLELYSEDEVIDFRDNVYYAKSLTEQAATPVLYQAVKYFGITQKQLRDLLESQYYENTELIIKAFWCGDENKMKELLLGKLSLYYDGNAYSLYDILFRPTLRETIPQNVRREYINSVEEYLKSDSDLYEKVYRKFIEEMLS